MKHKNLSFEQRVANGKEKIERLKFMLPLSVNGKTIREHNRISKMLRVARTEMRQRMKSHG